MNIRQRPTPTRIAAWKLGTLHPPTCHQELNKRSMTIYSVCIRDQKEAFSVRPRFPDHFKYLVLDVEDNEEQNVIRLFPE
jgi:hypothetical protein